MLEGFSSYGKTTDMDFLVRNLRKPSHKVNISESKALKQALEENNKTTLSKRPFSLEEMSKSELDAKLSHSYRQARSRQGKHVNDVFDAIDENHWN